MNFYLFKQYFLIRALFVGAFLCQILLVDAQNTRFRHLSVDDGLAQNSINAMTQDKNGFMWFGTTGGLNRYDGTEFKSFRHRSNDSTTISDNNILFVFAASDNVLWIGTRYSGLNRLDLKTNKITRFKVVPGTQDNLNDMNMLCAAEDKNGILYFGTNHGGINVYNKKIGKFTYITHDPKDANSIASNSIRTMVFDKQGKLWIGHSFHGGMSCYNTITKKAIRFSEGEANPNRKINGTNSVKALFCDSHNRIWISTWSGGINVYDQRQNKMYSNSAPPMDPYFKPYSATKSRIDSSFAISTSDNKFGCLKDARMVFGFTEDRYGNIWIATVEQGLISLNAQFGKMRQFKNNPNDASSICDNNLLSIYVDKSGIVWAGSLSSGLSIFNPYSDKFGYYKADSNQPFSMANSQVWSLHVGKYSHRTFVAVLGFVYSFDSEKNRFTNYVVTKKGESLLHPQSIVQSILEDHKGNLWISVNGSGVFVYDTLSKVLKNYNYKYGDTTQLANSTVNSIFEDKHHAIWLGVDSWGIDKFLPETQTFKHNYYKPGDKNRINADIVRHITDDKEGNLWISTDSGINILNPITEKIFTMKVAAGENKGIPSNDIQTVYRDKRNKMWIGTTNGLSFYDAEKKEFIDYTKKCGVSMNGVYGMSEDLNNNLWLLSAKGVTRFNTVTLQWKDYDVSDGLQSNEFPSNIIASIENGYIIMGGSKGLNYFLPELLTENSNTPSVVLTNFLLRNHPIKTKSDISYRRGVNLNYDHYFFTIEFASLDYTNTNKNKYKYKLEGFNDEWVELGNKRQVTFVNLDPGEYLFRVAGSNNDGVWNEEGATLKIVITPPFWKTKWFYTLCIITLILLVYSFIKFRERKLTKEKVVLESKVNLRTHQLKEEKEKVEEANKEIKDSINYAQKIQHAIMPTEEDFKKTLPQSFILFKPKDIVSGDFYWISHLPEGTVLYATADCTGHGVPGGFMSMLGTTFLNEIVNEKNITDPAKVLGILREKVIAALKQTGVEGENKDGMDITLIKLDLRNNSLVYAGANNPLWIQHNGENTITELKPDKQPIGYYVNQAEFTNHTLHLQKGDCIFSFTDGFADQFGGPKGKKFKYSTLEKILLSLDKNDLKTASEKLNEVFEEWRVWGIEGEKRVYEQTDDVCVIGVRI